MWLWSRVAKVVASRPHVLRFRVPAPEAELVFGVRHKRDSSTFAVTCLKPQSPLCQAAISFRHNPLGLSSNSENQPTVPEHKTSKRTETQG
jgi:hypothetical protein